MPWTATVQRDPDKPDVGTATAVWDQGGPDEFTYSRRASLTQASAQQFKVDAEAARDAELARRTANASLATTLEGVLNG